MRAFDPWPGAYFIGRGERIRVLAADASTAASRGAPGTVLDERLSVACGEGALRPLRLQRRRARRARRGRLPARLRDPARNGPAVPRYKLTIEYDGTGLVGWQRQPNGLSVQEALETAIAAFCGETRHGARRRAHRCRGARAGPGRACRPGARRAARRDPRRAQPSPAAACDQRAGGRAGRRPISTRGCRRPGGVYRYRILNRRAPPALERGRVWHVAPPLDVAAMREGARHLIGHHDFSTFRDSLCQAKSPVKTLDALDVSRRRRGNPHRGAGALVPAPSGAQHGRHLEAGRARALAAGRCRRAPSPPATAAPAARPRRPRASTLVAVRYDRQSSAGDRLDAERHQARSCHRHPEHADRRAPAARRARLSLARSAPSASTAMPNPIGMLPNGIGTRQHRARRAPAITPRQRRAGTWRPVVGDHEGEKPVRPRPSQSRARGRISSGKADPGDDVGDRSRREDRPSGQPTAAHCAELDAASSAGTGTADSRSPRRGTSARTRRSRRRRQPSAAPVAAGSRSAAERQAPVQARPIANAPRQPTCRRGRRPSARPSVNRARSARAEEPVEKAAVDRGQPRDVGELDPLVDLVHRLADEAELGDRAIGVDEARVRGAAGRAELRGAAGDRAGSRRSGNR